METVKVAATSDIEGKSIAELNFTQRKLVLIGVISTNPVHVKHKNRYQVSHQHFYFNPAQHFILQAGDLLLLLGRDVSIDYFRDQVEHSRLKHGRRR
jgi:voltage-gated potassium channel